MRSNKAEALKHYKIRRQVARHSSAALDFTYFLYTSSHTEVMEHHTDSIIAEYERFFLHDLRRSEAPESDLKAFSPGWFKRELERYGLFGFFGALTTINAIFMDEKRAALHGMYFFVCVFVIVD